MIHYCDTIMTTFFAGGTYRTPDRVPPHFLDFLFLKSRWGLYFGLLGAVLAARRAVLDGVYDDDYWSKSSFRVFRHVERCGGRFQIEGLNNLKCAKSPFVFVSNHMSTLESQILPVLIVQSMPVTFVVKRELIDASLFGTVMRSRNPIIVDRNHPGKDLIAVLEGGRKRLASGTSVIVFPQSTRSRRFDPAHFNSLGAKLAFRAGVPVIPVALKTDFWENGTLLRGFGPIRRKRTIHFEFGAPLSPGMGTKAIHARTVQFITQRLERWK